MFRKICALFLIMILLGSFYPSVFAENTEEVNFISKAQSTMDDISLWKKFNNVDSITKLNFEGDNVLHASGLGKDTWSSPSIDLFPLLKEDAEKHGGGKYQISYKIAFPDIKGDINLRVIMRCTSPIAMTKETNNNKTEHRAAFGTLGIISSNKWYQVSHGIMILPSNLTDKAEWLFVFDSLQPNVTDMYIDDFEIIRIGDANENDANGSISFSVFKSFSSTAPNADTPMTLPETSTDTPINNSSTDKEPAKILVNSPSSDFENVQLAQQTNWLLFSEADISISDEGYSGQCLKMTNHKNTWSSPMFDLKPYITESGTYSISLMAKLDAEEEKSLALIIRGGKETSFIKKQNTIYYGVLANGRATKNEWVRITAEFNVTNDDLQDQNPWRLCFSSIPLEATALYIDEFTFIKGESSQLSEVLVIQPILQDTPETEAPPLYDPKIKKAFISSIWITSATVIVVLVLKISGKKIIKKLKKEQKQ